MQTALDMTIREAEPSDFAFIARLSTELGYPASPQTVKSRIEKLVALPSDTILVALYNKQVVGCMHLSLAHSLIHDAHVVIHALIVSELFRGKGIGARLLSAAELWAKDLSIQSLLVRSNNIREDAHRFYLREGFHRIKTSEVFEKNL